MIVIDGPAGNGVGAGVAGFLGARHFDVEHKLFSDGESYIKIPALPKDDTVVVVQSTYAPQEKHLMELLFITDALREVGAKKIILVIPYLAYARQNRMFTPQEAVSINTVMRLLNESGAKGLVTVEPHSPDVLSLFKGKAIAVDSCPAFASALLKDVSKPFVVATDKGDMERAKEMAGLLKCGCDFIEKRRDVSTNAVSAVSAISTDLAGKDVVIYDDIISSGGTIELAANMAASKGAKSIIAAAAHLVMVGNAYERMKKAGVSTVYGSNTIPFKGGKLIDLSKDIAAAVRQI